MRTATDHLYIGNGAIGLYHKLKVNTSDNTSLGIDIFKPGNHPFSEIGHTPSLELGLFIKIVNPELINTRCRVRGFPHFCRACFRCIRNLPQ